MKFLLRFLAIAVMGTIAQATPANKAALRRHYGQFLGAGLDRCVTCHLPSSNHAPESLDDFPHNPFGDRLRKLRGESRDISARLKLVAKEDADNDGVSNEVELLAGKNPGDAKDFPDANEVAAARSKSADLKKFLAAYQWRPFETVETPRVPPRRRWGRNEIDAFIASEHAARTLRPRPEASRETLLRRVYLDLIGLSPAAGELAAFLADSSPTAYEKVVDRLLEDPRYGERWGRHWMDVWRYSDWAGWSGGNQIRDSKPHIWRWRDWTVESLNSDKPYDEMIVEMLAADELKPADTNALRATGFLVRNYKMLSREQWLEDTIKHTSQAFLGVTMGCAKCHDHMHDPISQKEYYQFRAIFEPHQVRTDRVPGVVDTAKDGLVRVFDTGSNPPTYFFVRGDERKPDTNRVLQPGVPRSLGGHYDLMPVVLPRIAAQPDRRPFVVADLLRDSEQAVEAARKKERSPENSLALQIAETKRHALEAILKTEAIEDAGRKDSGEWIDAAKSANRRQAELAVFEAKLRLLSAKGDTNKLAEAGKALEEAEKNAAAEATTQFKPRPAESYPDISTGRRLALARWIANERNPLTARVAVNQIWLRHFGKGLVETPADFGLNGRAPTHPALLDWLASEFVRGGWKMKHLHKLIVTSATYRMASTTDLTDAKIDPDNNYYWRMPSRRMEAEIVRDNLLHVAGDLDPAMGGPDIDHLQGLVSKRRSIYLRTAAEKEVEFLKIFDGPSVTECYKRHPSVVPQQALALANSELALKEARSLAEKLEGDDFIVEVFHRVLSRKPTEKEQRICSEFLAEQGKKASPDRARQNLVLTLFNHNDFVTIR